MSQSVDKQALIDLLEPPLQALGYELVDLEARIGGRGLLRIYIDREPAVTLADCEFVSEQIGALLDVEDPLPGHYVLEVSSPGIERRLRTAAHFERFLNDEIRVELTKPRDGRRRFRGRLCDAGEQAIAVDVDGTVWQLSLAEIADARLVIGK